MIESLYEILLKWKSNEDVAFICIEGEGEKAFCSCGDVRNLYDLRGDGLESYAINFFEKEYRMNMTIHTYPKPILAYMNGYVMGGGVGVGIGASHRIVTERSKWAMPEMNIGLYPDVGGSYFLPKMPGCIGTYLALTSNIIKPEDVIYVGAADYFVESSTWRYLKEELKSRDWKLDKAKEQLDKLLKTVAQLPEQASEIKRIKNKIDEHFCYKSVEEIVSSLEKAAKNGDEWASETVKTILGKSPTSLKVTLQQLINGKDRAMLECFTMEMSMSLSFMKGHDFFEGVRSVLVDKDRSPKWQPDSLEEVSMDEVFGYFSYPWKNGKNPLE